MIKPKTIQTLELDKIIDRLADFTHFSASETLVQALEPATSLDEAVHRQQETTEARILLDEKPTLTIGGAHDVRAAARNAQRGITLQTQQFLDIRSTLQSAAMLRKTINAVAERFPMLAFIVGGMHEGREIVSEITHTINDQGEVLDSASPKLAQLRSSLKVAHDRLRTKLQSIINSGQYSPYLQEALITMRGGRYVVPIKAEAKGRIKGIVHDQSASGQTLFIEPLATVEINNEIRSMELAEEEEVQRILRELSDLVGQSADEIVWTVDNIAHLDAAFARARYAAELRAVAPALVGFDERRVPGSVIRMVRARHPLLNQDTAVPIDVEMDPETFVLIITGPNTGGKTVSLKTVGLLVLMAQCGLHVPAADATLTVFEKVFADIGDEQSIEQSLSTFSGHLTHIIKILAEADDRSLVIIDELGSGTDPAEGAAIARAILTDFVQRGITTFVATHYPELKLYAHGTQGVRNASVEFNLNTLSPTYRLIIGLPGRSNAIAIATRLGLPQHIINEAQSYVGQDDLKTDALLDEIHTTRETIRQTEERLTEAERDALRLRSVLQQRLAGIEKERSQIIEQARVEAESELAILREEIAEQRRKLRTSFPQATNPQQEIRSVETAVEALQEMIDEPVIESSVEPPPHVRKDEVLRRALRNGDTVFVGTLGSEGEIVSIMDNGTAEVAVGQLRVRVDLDNLELRKSRKHDVQSAFEHVTMPSAESPGLELQVRGLTVDEALPLVDDYLDRAYRSGLPWVRIIHGKGSGALRKAIRDALRAHPLVKNASSAADNEGGDGATVVTFAA
jgi:DNA mismatch repair protein MutS2